MTTPYIDKIINYFAPGYALRRHAAREAFAVLTRPRSETEQRAFEVIESARYRDDWTNTTLDADAANVNNLQALRNMVRDLSHRSGIVSGPLKRLTNNVVGHGIRPQARVKEDGPYDGVEGVLPITGKRAEKFNYQIEKAWRNWHKMSDSSLQQNFYEQQGLAFRAMISDGESLVVLRSSDRAGRSIPLCIEIIEVDRLSTPMGKVNNPKVRNGIEFDDEGVPIRYYVLKRHPGATGIISSASYSEYETIEAFGANGLRKVIHLYDILRPGQSRGYTPFAAGLADIHDLSRYREAEIVAARIGACLAAFIRKPHAYNSWNNQASNTAGQKISQFEPGMVKYLNPGEEVDTFNPSRPNPAVADFTKQLLQWAANAVDMPYEVFANDWKDLNYSNARTVLLQAYLAFRVYQTYLVNHLCVPVWENFVSDCVSTGIIKADGFGLRKEDYFRSSWITPGWEWVDPKREAEAAQIDLESHISTLSEILASKGKDWEETLEQAAKESARQKELEEKYGIDLSATKKTGSESKKEEGTSNAEE